MALSKGNVLISADSGLNTTLSGLLRHQSSRSMRPFSVETPILSNETVVIATARQTDFSSISTSYNTDFLRHMQNPCCEGSLSSEYITKRKSPTQERSMSAEREQICTPSTCNSINIRQSNVSNIQDRNSNLSEDLKSLTYMGVMWYGGKLGVAFYNIDTSLIYVMLDSNETDQFTMLQRVLREVIPSYIVVSSKQDERMLHVIQSYVNEVTSETGVLDGTTDMLQFLPSIDFSIELCKRRVLSIALPSLPEHFTDTERTIYLSSLIPFENVCMIQALGGMLKFLEKTRAGIELEEVGTKLPVLDVKIFSIKSQMIVDNTAYSALQIFQKEPHSSVNKTGTRNSAKEGLSLFGILNKTKSQIGANMLRTWFQRPLKDLKMIQDRHSAIAFFNSPRNLELVTSLNNSVKHVKNITKIMARMMTSHASVGDWQALYKTVYHASCIRELCRVQTQSVEIIRNITEQFSEGLHKITNFINVVVDFDQCTQQGRFVVKSGIDNNLDKKKRIFSNLPEYLSKVAYDELSKLRENVLECSIIYMPQIGYLIGIPEAAIINQSIGNERLNINGLEFVFASNNIFNFRSSGTRELDNLLGDTCCDITDMENAIMHKLQNIILENAGALVVVLDLCAQLDCLLSLAACAIEYDYVRPKMTNSCIIEIVSGRHPIQEVCCSTFVPNDVQSNDTYGKIKVLTGPNACGKSVYLKQVALIVFMAHIGSFVPAGQATLGLIDKIFTRIRSLESVSVGLSTFMIDINQMAEALRGANENSLCIIDEFGKGTDMIDGLSLLTSCLMHWMSENDKCPHLMVSTHFHGLIHQHLLPRSNQLKYLTLETLHNGEELVFLYQIVEGHTSCSYAHHVASKAGIPLEIIKRGTHVSDLLRDCKPVERVDTVSSEAHFNNLQLIAHKFLELDLDTADLKQFLTGFVTQTSQRDGANKM